MSPHQHGINDLLATLKLLGREPGCVVLIGVEPAIMKLSMDLSPLVAGVMPEMIARVSKEVAALSARVAERRAPGAPSASGVSGAEPLTKMGS
jgi:hydrogenase maturation protease